MSNAHKLFRRIAAEAGGSIMTSTVPIYRDVQGATPLDFDRTGVLLRIGSEHFVVTAAHEIKSYLDGRIWLYADVSRRFQAPIPLVQSKFYWTEVDDRFPDRDIAVIHLNQDAVDQFFSQRRFLSLADCDQMVDPRPALYMVAGIPADTYQMTPVAGGPAFFFLGTIEPTPTTSNFDSRVHLALSVDGYGLRAAENEFVADAIPEFYGMSGCGIWRIAPASMSDPDSWDVSKIRLVAIQNRTQHGSHTIGTWLKHVVDRIVAELPHLNSATKIEYPAGY